MVNLIDCGKREFINQVNGKKLYCFGAGKYLQRFIESRYGIAVEAVIDNYRYTDTESIYIDDRKVRVISADMFAGICDDNSAIIITCISIQDVLEQLDSMQECDGIDCYVELFIEEYIEHTEINIENRPTKEVIPKKIHYCWFGGKEVPEEYQKYIATWKKYCPDYEIIRWDESNYNVHKNRYIKEAYEQKKWAFVSDYARVDILYHEGGIYFDTDVEVIAPFDEFLVWDLFCGFECGNYIAWGLGVGAIKGHPILKSILEIYENMSFIQADGSLNLKSCPVIQSEVMEEYGFKRNGEFQVRDNVAVFPQEFFCPINSGKCYGRITEYSHSIHHYAASWIDAKLLSDREKAGEQIRRIKAHNRIGKPDENYEEQNLKSRIKRFQIWNCLSENDTAGSKAPMDIKKIFGDGGYQVIKIHPCNGAEEDWSHRRLVQDWDNCYNLIPDHAILLLQHPFWQEQKKRNETLLKLKEHKHVRIISFVHDVEKLRGIFVSEYMRAEFSFMLQIADVLIVHNDKMKESFLELGVKREKLISLGIFDYLSDGSEKVMPAKKFEKSISIAGNLNVIKSPYIKKLQDLAPLKVHLYGPNYSGADMAQKDNDNVVYHGTFPAGRIQEKLNCGFGLVWDGDSLNTCAGSTGEYLRYNNPHKLSLYLSAGLPVIIWKQAAEAEFVEKNGVGIAVDSLYELKGIFENMDEEQYRRYLKAIEPIACGIKKGENTRKAIKMAEAVLKRI